MIPKWIQCEWVVSLAAICTAFSVQAASPVVKEVFPLGVAPGRTTPIQFIGQNFTPELRLWTSDTRVVTELADTNAETAARFNVYVPATAPDGIMLVRLISAAGISEPRLVLIDSLRSVRSEGTNTARSSALLIETERATDGRIDPVRSHWFRIDARKNQALHLEVVAARLGSAMDPVLRLLDETGRELAYCEDDPELGPDARIHHIAQRTEPLFIELRDTRYQGGSDYFYRLQCGSAAVSPSALLADNLPSAYERESERLFLETEPNNSPAEAVAISFPTRVRGDFHRVNDRDLYRLKIDQPVTLVIT